MTLENVLVLEDLLVERALWIGKLATKTDAEQDKLRYKAAQTQYASFLNNVATGEIEFPDPTAYSKSEYRVYL